MTMLYERVTDSPLLRVFRDSLALRLQEIPAVTLGQQSGELPPDTDWDLGSLISQTPGELALRQLARDIGLQIGALPIAVYQRLYRRLLDIAPIRNTLAGIRLIFDIIHGTRPYTLAYAYTNAALSGITLTVSSGLLRNYSGVRQNAVLDLLRWTITRWSHWRLGVRPSTASNTESYLTIT